MNEILKIINETLQYTYKSMQPSLRFDIKISLDGNDKIQSKANIILRFKEGDEYIDYNLISIKHFGFEKNEDNVYLKTVESAKSYLMTNLLYAEGELRIKELLEDTDLMNKELIYGKTIIMPA